MKNTEERSDEFLPDIPAVVAVGLLAAYLIRLQALLWEGHFVFLTSLMSSTVFHGPPKVLEILLYSTPYQYV